jgi:glyoxylase-like metal-dependent hydrolase (beta-lactamase superfamily II)
MTNSTVIDAHDAVILADPSWLPHEVMAIRQYLDGMLGERPLYLMFTHSHFDHIIDAGAFPEAMTVASQAFVGRSDFQESLDDIRDFDDEWCLERPHPIRYPAIQHPVGHLATIQDGRMKLQVLLAPRHGACSMFVLETSTGTLLAGDYLSDVEMPPSMTTAAALSPHWRGWIGIWRRAMFASSCRVTVMWPIRPWSFAAAWQTRSAISLQ